jgi:hypothetical protein
MVWDEIRWAEDPSVVGRMRQYVILSGENKA